MKYILEIDDIKEGVNGAVIEVMFDSDGSYGSVSLPKNRLTPYLADAVYQEGASHGERLGRQEAQEVYRGLAKLHDGEMKEIFEDIYCKNIIQDFTVDSIEQKLKKYNNHIRIGDEVNTLHSHKNGGIVMKVFEGANTCTVMWPDGSCGSWEFCLLKKTGRHFDEVEELLKKLKG